MNVISLAQTAWTYTRVKTVHNLPAYRALHASIIEVGHSVMDGQIEFGGEGS